MQPHEDHTGQFDSRDDKRPEHHGAQVVTDQQLDGRANRAAQRTLVPGGENVNRIMTLSH